MDHTYQQVNKHELRVVHYNMHDVAGHDREGQEWWKLMWVVYRNIFIKNSERSPRVLLCSVREKAVIVWEMIRHPQ